MSRRDLDFLLYEWLDVVELTKHEHFAEHSRDTFDAVLDLCEDAVQGLIEDILPEVNRRRQSVS